MTIRDAEYLEYATFVDYNKPVFWNSENRYLDNKIVKATEWNLKPDYMPIRLPRIGGFQNNDFVKSSSSVICIGTELQRHNKFKEMFEKYGWQIQTDYDVELKRFWLNRYRKNNNQPFLILNVK